MSESPKCPRCGAELPADGPGGHCISCLLQLGLAAAPDATPTATIRIVPPGQMTTEKPGDRIGRYKLLQQIGEGGCGVVYMAEQAEPMRRRVALKVIKLGMDTKQVIARFEAERQALALMDHPNIAKVLDAGATDAGRPYFVMELVRGIRITDYCDEQRLSTRQRLELFVQVCQAVQHAHQKGIIHRDLKPSNILVTEQDGKAVPKIIDFGIAKATTAAPLTDKTLFTAFDQFIGTPAYMSPEQAGLGGLDIDTRSDVYSLGVLLYELLTGKQPFDSASLKRSAIDEILRIIREQEPPRPSACLTTLTEEELTVAAVRRQTEPAKFSNLLRGDLDWIVMKTLEKDRARRYETANGLAADIHRHLINEPIVARPPSNVYRLRKMVRRHRVAFGAAGGILAVLFLGTVVSTWQAVRATRAEREEIRLRQDAEMQRQNEKQLRQKAETAENTAQTEAAKSREVAQFLTEMLRGVTPLSAVRRDTTLLREILQKTATRLDTDLKDQPEVQGDLYQILGSVFDQINELSLSEAMCRSALAAKRKTFGNTNAAVAQCLSALAGRLGRKYKLAESEATYREALALQKDIYGKDNYDSVYSLMLLGLIVDRRGRLPEAEDLCRQALEMDRRLGVTNRSAHDMAWFSLGGVLRDEGRSVEAESAFREGLAPTYGAGKDGIRVANFVRQLADTLQDQGRLDEAEDIYRHVIQLFEAYGTNTLNQSLGFALNNFGNSRRLRGELKEAEQLMRRALSIRSVIFEEWHPYILDNRRDLFHVLREEGKSNEAEDELRKWLGSERKFCADDPARLAEALCQSADYCYEKGETIEAASFYRELTGTCLPAAREDDVVSSSTLAWCLATCLDPGFRDPTNAIRLGEKTVQITGRKNPQILGVLAAAYAADGQFERAAATQKEALLLAQGPRAKAESAARLALYEGHKPYRGGN